MCPIDSTTGSSPLQPHHHTIATPTQLTTLQKHIPPTPLSESAYKAASSFLPLPILHHSLRTFLFADRVWERENQHSSERERDLLFVAAIFHDAGATDACDGPQRFEVEGGDAAVSFLDEYSHQTQDVTFTSEEKQLVWNAIALHASPGIAERMDWMSRAIRAGVLIDFRPASRTEWGMDEYGAVIEGEEGGLARLEIEVVLGRAVVGQVLRRSGDEASRKAPPASWVGVMKRGYDEGGWDGARRAF